MKKLILFACLSLLAVGQTIAQDYTLTRGIPGIIFGYPSEVPLIDDQSDVGTIVWPNLSEITYMGEYTLIAVDGVRIPNRIRSSPFRRHEASCLAVDLLPGQHTLSVSYSEYLPLVGSGRRTYNISSPAPVDVVVDVEAGGVYQLRALLSQGAFTGFSVDRELTDPTIIDRLAQSRKVNRIAYTPLAGRAGTIQSVQSASERRTVQPAKPKIVRPATQRRTVPPATPRRTVQKTVQSPTPTEVMPPITTQATAQLPDDVVLIHIYRVKKMAGAAIGYNIHWDDDVIWRAKNNSKATIRLTVAGAAALWAKTESRVELPFDIQLGCEYYVRCGIKMGAFVGRPELELVDATTGKAEFNAIPSSVTEISIPAHAPTE
jgi:hypothetical protein